MYSHFSFSWTNFQSPDNQTPDSCFFNNIFLPTFSHPTTFLLTNMKVKHIYKQKCHPSNVTNRKCYQSKLRSRLIDGRRIFIEISFKFCQLKNNQDTSMIKRNTFYYILWFDAKFRILNRIFFNEFYNSLYIIRNTINGSDGMTKLKVNQCESQIRYN